MCGDLPKLMKNSTHRELEKNAAVLCFICLVKSSYNLQLVEYLPNEIIISSQDIDGYMIEGE